MGSRVVGLQASWPEKGKKSTTARLGQLRLCVHGLKRWVLKESGDLASGGISEVTALITYTYF